MVKIRIAKFRPDDVQPLPARMQSVAVVVPDVPELDIDALRERLTGVPDVLFGATPEWQLEDAIQRQRRYSKDEPYAGQVYTATLDMQNRQLINSNGAELELSRRLAEQGYVEEFPGHGCYVQKPAVCDAFQTDDRSVEHCGVCQQHRSAHKEPL